MKADYQIKDLISEFPEVMEFGASKRKRVIDLDLSDTALLILDMQDYFLDESSHAYVPSSEYLIKQLVSLAEAARKSGLTVIKTRHIDISSDNNQMTSWWRDRIDIKSKYSNLTPEIGSIKGDDLTKSQYDAFYGTDLKNILKRKGIRQIIVTGVVTHLCVETTIRSAFVHGFLPIIPIDGTAAFTRDQHLNSLKNLEHGFAILSTIEHLKSKMELR